ncbi:uncharacterized protein [Littorina saxatilis]|uniref:uncharacterized protein isoform X2 n=1 Tax=Littorina saxatilis TaxID=31220 RepID=UPI0038B5E1B5
METGAIAGVCVALIAIAILTIIAGVVYYVKCRRRRCKTVRFKGDECNKSQIRKKDATIDVKTKRVTASMSTIPFGGDPRKSRDDLGSLALPDVYIIHRPPPPPEPRA